MADKVEKKPKKSENKAADAKKTNNVVESVKSGTKKAVDSTKNAAVKAKESIAPSKNADGTKGKRKPLSLIIAIALTVVVVLLATFGVLIYKFKQDSPLVYKVSQVVPYPVMRVNGEFVSYGRFLLE